MKTTSRLALSIAAFTAFTTLAMSAPAQADPQERREARRDADPMSRSSEVTTRRGTFSRAAEAGIGTEGEHAYRSRTVTGPEGETGGVLGEISRTENGTNTSQTLTDEDR